MANSRTRTQHITPSGRGELVARPTVLGFKYENGIYFGRSGRGIFKPRGLMIWGAPDGAHVRSTTIDMEEQVLQSMDGAPAHFFAFGLSFEQISKLVEEGLEPPQWCEFATMHRGSVARVIILSIDEKVLGPSDGVTIAMWGHNIGGAGELEPAAVAPPLLNGAGDSH